MPAPLTITNTDRTSEELLEFALNCKDHRQRRRVRAIAFRLDGMSPGDVAAKLGTTVQSVRDWTIRELCRYRHNLRIALFHDTEHISGCGIADEVHSVPIPMGTQMATLRGVMCEIGVEEADTISRPSHTRIDDPV